MVLLLDCGISYDLSFLLFVMIMHCLRLFLFFTGGWTEEKVIMQAFTSVTLSTFNRLDFAHVKTQFNERACLLLLVNAGRCRRHKMRVSNQEEGI